MTRKTIYALIASFTAIATVALLLAFIVIPGSSTGTEGATVAASSGSPSEGIAVHGHWTINVLNPDGSLAEHREFENALHGQGKELLKSIFARQSTLGRWYVIIGSSTGGPCNSSTGNPTYCVLCEPSFPQISPYYIKNLTPTETGSGDTIKFVLSGSASIANTAEIGWVNTKVELCSATMSPSDCGSSTTVYDSKQLTFTYVSPTIAVQAGQQVQVTVEISFG